MTEATAESSIHAVDLFCGIGGLTHGLGRSGVMVKAGFDNDESCRYAYEANNRGSRFVTADIRDIGREHIEPYFAGADATLMVGCAPCQPFSAHNRKWRKDADCSLVYEFARLINEVQPDLVSMENVPGLAKHRAFADFLEALQRLGYDYDADVILCSDYGVPQKRERLVLLASRLGPITIPRLSSSRPTVREFLGGLPSIADGVGHPDDPAHIAMPLSKLNKRRIQQSKPGGTWKDWDDTLLSACHRTSYYPAPYGRMCWDEVAPTITTQFCYYSTGRFGHPEQDRAITVREGALLQTFPMDYEFSEKGHPIVVRDAARHIGNAVPVNLAQAIGSAMVEAACVQ
ncbi:MAG: DNA cytosine methyltransferase [Gammaproteobacteria bacterium]|nr:DNA cytosine methyltransferase [Gammaproteobacteria bacterium]